MDIEFSGFYEKIILKCYNHSVKDPTEKLNERQKEALYHTKGPLLIIAGAGAGKTKTITHRIVRLIETGIAPEAVLAVTFTNKAALEMKERVSILLKKEGFGIEEYGEGPLISTFHGLGVRIIKENYKSIGIKKHFSIYDRNDSLTEIKESMKEAGFDPKEYEPRKFLHIISQQKSKGYGYEDFIGEWREKGFEEMASHIWERYEKRKFAHGALDFDDLLLVTLRFLQKNLDIQAIYQKRWLYIHVDEYQDTNLVQYKLIKLLVGKDQNLCVVGDIDQAIYSWRGADYTNILNFEKDFPQAKTILLEENYRSTKTIIAASNEVISKNINRKEKVLFTKKGLGEKIGVHVASDESEESNFVAAQVENLIKEGVNPNAIAVLYRANFISRVLEEAFLAYRIPYQVVGTRFFERKEIKDMIAYIRASQNKNDFLSIERVINAPTRGIGKVTLAKLAGGKYESLSGTIKKKVDDFFSFLEKIRISSKTLPLDELLKYIVKGSGLEEKLSHGGEDDIERLENIYELISIAKKYDNPSSEDRIETFLTDTSLMTSDQDELKASSGVKLMTVHASKGLEFSHVFVVGLEEGLFPHNGIGDKNKDPEEERRLFYVAMTRAQKKLYLSYALSRTLYGREHVNIPSEFLLEIDEKYTESSSYLGFIQI